jgi:L-fuculose-phosphate aldolase
MNDALLHPRDEIVATMERVYRHGMTTTSGGNISIREPNGDTWITPARVDKGGLQRTDIVRLARDGAPEGIHPPSSEFPFHLGIYKARPGVCAVIHAHPESLVSFSICGKIPDTRVFAEASQVCGPVGFAPYALPGSELLGRHIAKAFADCPDCFCVLLENHGVVIAGEDMASAFKRFETLEFTAATILNAGLLGPVHYLDEPRLELARKPREPLPEQLMGAATSVQKEMRKQICDFVHRAYEQRLMTSTEGSFSARTGPDEFIITPSYVDRWKLDLGDLVLIQRGARGMGDRPSRAARLHRAIYRQHPEFRAIVNAHPVHATAFAVSDFPLDTRTIPESYLLLRDVGKIPFEQHYGDGREAARVITPEHPVALLENNGVMVAGRSVLDAFDRLEVLDATASALLRAHSLGPLTPMPAKVIEELAAAFPGI